MLFLLKCVCQGAPLYATHTHTRTHTRTRTHTCTHAHARTRMHTCTHAHAYSSLMSKYLPTLPLFSGPRLQTGDALACVGAFVYACKRVHARVYYIVCICVWVTRQSKINHAPPRLLIKHVPVYKCLWMPVNVQDTSHKSIVIKIIGFQDWTNLWAYMYISHTWTGDFYFEIDHTAKSVNQTRGGVAQPRAVRNHHLCQRCMWVRVKWGKTIMHECECALNEAKQLCMNVSAR